MEKPGDKIVELIAKVPNSVKIGGGVVALAAMIAGVVNKIDDDPYKDSVVPLVSSGANLENREAIAHRDPTHFEYIKGDLLQILIENGEINDVEKARHSFLAVGNIFDAERATERLIGMYIDKSEENHPIEVQIVYLFEAEKYANEIGKTDALADIHHRIMEMGKGHLSDRDVRDAVAQHLKAYDRPDELKEFWQNAVREMIALGKDYRGAYLLEVEHSKDGKVDTGLFLDRIMNTSDVNVGSLVSLIFDDTRFVTPTPFPSRAQKFLIDHLAELSRPEDILAKMGIEGEKAAQILSNLPKKPELAEKATVEAPTSAIAPVFYEQAANSIPAPAKQLEFAQKAEKEGNDEQAFNIYKGLQNEDKVKEVGRRLSEKAVEGGKPCDAVSWDLRVGDKYVAQRNQEVCGDALLKWRRSSDRCGDDREERNTLLCTKPYSDDGSYRPTPLEAYFDAGAHAKAQNQLMIGLRNGAITSIDPSYSRIFRSPESMDQFILAQCQDGRCCNLVDGINNHAEGKYFEEAASCHLAAYRSALSGTLGGYEFRMAQEEDERGIEFGRYGSVSALRLEGIRNAVDEIESVISALRY